MSDFIEIPVHVFVLFLPVAFIGNIGFAALTPSPLPEGEGRVRRIVNSP